MRLFVVMTNLPGPGAHALLQESGHAFGGKTGDAAAEHSRQVREVLAGASEFVELEDEHGASHGADVGVSWETVSPFTGPSTARLGPFHDAAEVEDLRRALADLVKLAEEARGHYGIEECAGPGKPATNWDDLQDDLRAAAAAGRSVLGMESSA